MKLSPLCLLALAMSVNADSLFSRIVRCAQLCINKHGYKICAVEDKCHLAEGYDPLVSAQHCCRSNIISSGTVCGDDKVEGDKVYKDVCCILPTDSPTSSPSKAPSKGPTARPSHSPTKSPTKSPTPVPSIFPMRVPTTAPSRGPTQSPSESASSPRCIPESIDFDEPGNKRGDYINETEYFGTGVNMNCTGPAFSSACRLFDTGIPIGNWNSTYENCACEDNACYQLRATEQEKCGDISLAAGLGLVLIVDENGPNWPPDDFKHGSQIGFFVFPAE
eukprot:scaffold750_cov151-Amphora_coffeaeformis.AAC.1